MTSATSASPEAPATSQHPPLRRMPRQRVVAGVCGGLGRHFDLDPVVFRVVTGVLAAAGGTGLIFYGFAWLCVTADGEDESEARRLLTGRVGGASLVAVLTALVGCGLFLSMAGGNGGVIGFAVLLACATGGAAVWSQRRRLTGAGETAAEAHPAGPDAPPETKAPPLPVVPSWWRDPIVKDGSTGPVPLGYLWGPADGPHAGLREDPHRAWGAVPGAPPRTAAAPGGRRSLSVLTLLLAAVAGYAGTAAAWDGHPLGVSLQFGFGAALAVFALGLVVSSFLGRTGFVTVLMTVVTALLLAGASAIPSQIDTVWTRAEWAPASIGDLRPRYALGSGVGSLDLSALDVPRGRTVGVAAEVGAGRLAVTVPAGVTVRARAQAGLGDIRLPGPPATGSASDWSEPASSGDPEVAADLDVTRTVPPPPGAAPGGTLELDLRIGVGRVEVVRAAS